MTAGPGLERCRGRMEAHAMDWVPPPAAAAAADITTLPHCVYRSICELVYEGETSPRCVLAKRIALMRVCKALAAATRHVPLELDLREGSPDLAAVKSLLQAAPVSRLFLHREMRGDEILRDPRFRALSAASLRELAASVCCTDTLQPFRGLQLLHLQANVLPKLYPAVLWGVAGLQRLSLHHYEDFCLTDLPAALVPTVKSVDVTPVPKALHSSFRLRLPPGMALHRLVVHGSFHTIHSPRAAPRATVDVAEMCGQCQEVLIEAEDIVFELPPALLHPPPGPLAGSSSSAPSGAEAFAAALLHSWGPRSLAWRRLEFRLLGGIALAPRGSCAEGQEGAQEEQVPPEAFAVELQHALLGAEEEGELTVSLRREQASIFEPMVVVIERL